MKIQQKKADSEKIKQSILIYENLTKELDDQIYE